MRRLYSILIFLFVTSLIFAESSFEKKSKLQKFLDGVEYIKYEAIDGDDLVFSEVYQIFITQPLDHENPNAGTFSQKVYLSHIDFSQPTLIETEGYAASNHTKELSYLLGSNQIIVEHRYFGDSQPDSLDWQYLNIKQAAADHHRIIELFKNIYSGKWIASGISKGGQTSIYHRYFYPEDVDVTVPYVAPMNLEREDARIPEFISSVGSEDCRNKIIEFQKSLLLKRDSLIQILEKHSAEKKYVFPMGLELAFEYNVLEYSFAFWQWGYSDCTEIPITAASAQVLFDHLIKASSFNYFTKESCDYLAPFFYQAYTELGYYGYDAKPFEGLLKAIEGDYASSVLLAPQDEKLVFDASVMNSVNDWLISSGNNMLFIYGEVDPWSATAATIGEKTNSVKMVKKGGCHRTRIRSFEGEEKEKIYSTLENWLNLKIERKNAG